MLIKLYRIYLNIKDHLVKLFKWLAFQKELIKILWPSIDSAIIVKLKLIHRLWMRLNLIIINFTNMVLT
jgi:hypothetical protein